jgi:hypothetical protein
MGFSLGKPDHGRPQTGFTVDKDGKKVYRMPSVPREWKDVPIPPPKTINGIAKMHVDMFLKSRSCPLWERGGKVRFAQLKGKEFATEQEFEQLFKSY